MKPEKPVAKSSKEATFDDRLAGVEWPPLAGPGDCQVQVASNVVQAIHQHARGSMRAEVCGVLIGEEVAGGTRIEASIPGDHAAQGGSHVTFTQETWEHIYKVKDEEFPDKRIVGWYHSHPGFGIFLSQQDRFIHEHFFSAPCQVAWVYDPHSEEEGCFGWIGSKLMRLSSVQVVDPRGNQEAEPGEEPDAPPPPPEGDSGSDSPAPGNEDESARPAARVVGGGASRARWRRRFVLLFAMAVVFVAGVAVGLNLLPRTFVMYSMPDGRLLSEEEMRTAVERALQRQGAARPEGVEADSGGAATSPAEGASQTTEQTAP